VRERLAAPDPEALLTERLESFDGRAFRPITEPGRREPVGGVLTLVERYSINLPWTTRLSLDLFRSKCKVSAKNALADDGKGAGGKLEGHTVTIKLKIHMISYLYIDDTQEALISPLELALIEDLYCDNGRILDHTES